ncbi:MAG: RloB family protein [Bacteroidales bacterium]|nr:RloB family protein [Caldisericia bacterium]MDD4431847.1 RloB family protein [Bacteroidales bacterium]
MAERNGKRKTREELLRRRVPELGYYLIVTDTKETEKNYMNGLRDSIPERLRRKLVVKVSGTKTDKLVREAIEAASLQPQYREPWIIFDRDRVNNFDQIIQEAEQNGIKTGWSNPCIEIWFSAYLGKIPGYDNSVACCNGFAQKFPRITGREYDKSDTRIYSKLCEYGDEKKAIINANSKYREQNEKCNSKPSEMCPCTTVYRLVKEIKEKINKG